MRAAFDSGGFEATTVQSLLQNAFTYNSPTTLLSAIGLLMFFARLRIHGVLGGAIVRLAPNVFAVYLISDHVITRNAFMHDALLFTLDFRVASMLLAAVAIAVCIVIVCVAVDKLRATLFSIARLDKGIKAFGLWIDDLVLGRKRACEELGNADVGRGERSD